MTMTQSSRYRFIVVGLCFLLGLVNYLDRVVISFAIEPIKKDFGLDNTTFGLVISAFALGTVAVNGLAGWLLDRTNVRALWTVSLFFWSVMMILLGMAHVLILLLALRFLLGVGEGVNFPAMNRAMADWMDRRELSRMVSVGVLGVPLALLIGGPLLSNLIESIGWRWSFVGLGGMGIGLGFLWVLLYRNGPNRFRSDGDSNTTAEPWWHLLKNPTLMATSWSFFAFGYVLWFAISWIPGYMEQTYGMKLTSIGWFSTLPWALALVLIPLAGWISDRLMARTGSIRVSRVHVIWVCQLVAAAFFAPLLFTTSSTVAIICLSLAIGFSMMPNGPYYSICTDLSHDQAGAATGIMITFFSVSGIVSPLLTGWLSDLFGGFAAAFGALIVCVVTAVAGMIVFARPDTVRSTTGAG